MKVFVAGGSGQLGTAAIPLLVAAGHEVRATARGVDKGLLVKGLGATPVDVDMFDSGALGRAIAGSDAVCRLTTKIPGPAAMRNPKSWAENNRLRTDGARALVDAVRAQGVSRYVSESVAYVYADGADDWVTEEHPTAAAGLPILEAALSSETEAGRVTAGGGTGVVLRFAAFYSPTSAATLQVARLAKRRLFPVIGKGENYFSSISVTDAGAGVVAALGLPAGLYNVADDAPQRFSEYVSALAAAVGGPAPLRVPRVVGKAGIGSTVAVYLLRSLRLSNRKLREAGDWTPRDGSIHDGLARMADQLRA